MCALIQFHRSLYGCATVYVSHCGYYSVIFTVFTVQAVFSQSEALEGDGSAETQYTYYPATIADATTGTMVTTVQASDTLLGQTTPTGNHCVSIRPGCLCALQKYTVTALSKLV